jgi:hypothetical protein
MRTAEAIHLIRRHAAIGRVSGVVCARREPAAIRRVDRVPEAVPILVHSPLHPDRIRGEEGPELWIEVSGMEVYASVFGARARESRLAGVVRQDDGTTVS